MKFSTLAVGTLMMIGSACDNSLQPMQKRDGDHILTHVTAQKDIVALYVSVRGGKVATLRHVHNGRLMIESDMREGRRSLVIFQRGRAIRASLAVEPAFTPQGRIYFSRLLQLLGPAPLEAQRKGTECGPELAEYAAATWQLNLVIAESLVMPPHMPGIDTGVIAAIDRWQKAAGSLLACIMRI